MRSPISLDSPPPIPFEAELRHTVREFLAGESYLPRCDAWLSGFEPEFTKRLARRGLVGLTIPERYGGHGRSPLERFVVAEELLAAGAPVAAHWIADRQTAPLLLRYGTEQQRTHFLPAIAAGECYFGIGMSEPDSGSDLASIRTTAEPVGGGFVVNGRKIWTSNAHRCHFLIALCRTSPKSADRHRGMSQLIVDLRADGVEVRPIALLTGEHHFSEVLLEDVYVRDSMVVGEVGAGWSQVLSELAFERSGPERLLSTFPLLAELAREIGTAPDRGRTTALGKLVANVEALRCMSLSVAASLEAGDDPIVQAALVKDAGTRHEQDIVETARLQIASEPRLEGGSRFEELLAQAIFAAPGFTLRGGTTEILRGIVARGLSLR